MKILHQTKISLFQVLIIFGVTAGIGVLSFFSFANDPTPNKNVVIPSKRNPVVIRDSIEKDTSALAKLLYSIDTLSISSSLHHGSFGFSLVSIDNNSIIAEYESHKSLVPASVIKTLSTGVALSKLGPDYQYLTNLQYDGDVDPATGILHGNIYIKGSGDPSLGSDVFGNNVKSVLTSWTTAIKNLGIDSIDGSIIGDGEYFEHQLIPGGWAWEDMQSSYGIGCSGLAFRENTFDVNVTCRGKIPQASTYPPIPGIVLHNQLVFNPSIYKNYLFVTGAPYQNERVIMGEIKSNYSERSNIPDPALCCAYNLFLNLKTNKIGIKDSCTTVRNLKLGEKYTKVERKTFYTTYSPTLNKMVNYTNKTSQNFYAETFIKTLGAKKNGFGSTVGGIKEVISYLKEKEIDLHGFYMVDGSGISRYNALTPKFLTDLLVTYSKDPVIFPHFYKSLSVAGESGTMYKMAEETIAQGNIHAKSGSMTRVHSYTGYVTTKSGKLLAFSMIVNNQGWDYTQTKKQLEKLMILMANLE
jgi:D-alanyl-D-alanine carboxypeptidase/D-alanyl-D-alanine-endopeptidase (penicillin-binding protein 4)